MTRPQSTQIFDQTLFWMFLWAEEQTKTLKDIQFTHRDICWISVLSGSLVARPNFLKRRVKVAVITWCFAVLKNSTGPLLKKCTIFESLLSRKLKISAESLWRAECILEGVFWTEKTCILKDLNMYPMRSIPREEDE